MNWSDIKDGVWHNDMNKTGEITHIPLMTIPRISRALARVHEEAVRMADDRRKHARTAKTGELDSDLVFPAIRIKGENYKPVNTINQRFVKMRKGTGFQDRILYGLRNTFIVRMINQGMTEREIMAMTGHKTSRQLGGYARGMLTLPVWNKALAA